MGMSVTKEAKSSEDYSKWACSCSFLRQLVAVRLAIGRDETKVLHCRSNAVYSDPRYDPCLIIRNTKKQEHTRRTKKKVLFGKFAATGTADDSCPSLALLAREWRRQQTNADRRKRTKMT